MNFVVHSSGKSNSRDKHKPHAVHEDCVKLTAYVAKTFQVFKTWKALAPPVINPF